MVGSHQFVKQGDQVFHLLGNNLDTYKYSESGLEFVSTDDIFGVGYPWLEDMQLLDDGSLLILLTQKRNDESANELMFFRLTGF